MKLYTRPRPIPAFLTRPGDQLATGKASGKLITSETEYIDLDLRGGIAWTVVHGHNSPEPDALRIEHTTAESEVFPMTMLIVREVIEIDPWTYVRPDSSDQQ